MIFFTYIKIPIFKRILINCKKRNIYIHTKHENINTTLIKLKNTLYIIFIIIIIIIIL